MIEIKEKKNCCGCTACASICRYNAITMKPDGFGFLYPVVDVSKCKDCGACNIVCEFNPDYERYGNYEVPQVFGCRHKNEDELAKSQSGAASWAIIEWFLSEMNGVVYGVGYDTPTHIIHKRGTSLEECKEFRGSKYVQSDMRNIFPLIKKDLQEGRVVLFTGTACQVAGLKSFIPNRFHDNLITIDIVCHAAPSPAVWESYNEYIEKKHKKKVVKVNFRDQYFGWHSHEESFIFEDGSKVSGSAFRKLFYDHMIIRKSCIKCHFTNLKRVSDITLGDFWGWENHCKEWNDNKGVSLFMINSARGREIKEQLSNWLNFIESEPSKCLQPQLQHPIVAHPDLDEISDLFVIKGFKGVASKYGFIPGKKYYIDKFYFYRHQVHLFLSHIKHHKL